MAPAVETDPSEALKNTDRRLRSLLKRLSDAGVADNDQDVKREMLRSRRQTRANREILGLDKPAPKKRRRAA